MDPNILSSSVSKTVKKYNRTQSKDELVYFNTLHNLVTTNSVGCLIRDFFRSAPHKLLLPRKASQLVPTQVDISS